MVEKYILVAFVIAMIGIAFIRWLSKDGDKPAWATLIGGGAAAALLVILPAWYGLAWFAPRLINWMNT